MKKIFLLTFFTIATFNLIAQENIIGETNKKELLMSEHKSWFQDSYEDYKPSPEIVEELTKNFKTNKFQIDVYFGTWCEDSQREVPQLIKLLEHSKFDFKKLKLTGVDEDKIIPNVSEKKREALDVFNVPTIIVYKNGKEINRFVEYAQETLEKDMLKIFSGEPYKHSYYN